MALPIRQGATHKVVVGPFVDVGDGFTPETGVALTTADEAEVILHDNGTVVDISGYTWAAITTADGYYHLTLQSGISNTVGHLTVVVQDDSVCLPVRQDFIVLDTGIYDSIYADAAVGLATQASVDTIDNFLDTEVAAITAAVITNAAGADVAADIIALKAVADTLATTADLLDKVGAVDETAADGDPSSTESVMQYVKQLVNVLVGSAGVVTMPAAAAPANAVSLAEIIRAIYDDTNELQVDDYPTSIAAVKSDTAATLIDTNELQTDWTNGGRLDLLIDAIKAITDLLTLANINAQVDGAFTTQMADSVSTDGAIATREQALYMLLQFLTEFGISGTAYTTYKVDGTTPLFTTALNSATTPTAMTRDG